MIVDDDPLMAGLVQKSLSKLDAVKLSYFEKSEKALKALKKQKPDLIILDWSMPKITGLQFLIQIRSDKKTEDISVFMLTAKNKGADFMAASEAGVDGYITKPINFEQLNTRIESHIIKQKKLVQSKKRKHS